MSAPRLFDRAVIRLSPTEPGEDVRGFLQGLVTQDMNAELPLWAGLLTPQGKALFDFLLWSDPSIGSGQMDVLIDCEAEQAEALVRRLSIYRLRRKISVAVDASLAVYWVWRGVKARQILACPAWAIAGWPRLLRTTEMSVRNGVPTGSQWVLQKA